MTLNAGGAISPSTGFFTCPVPGTYLFIGESVSVWPQINNWFDLTAGTSGFIHENAGDIVLGCTNSQSSSLEISPKRLKKPCSCSEPGNAQREEGADQFEETETRL